MDGWSDKYDLHRCAGMRPHPGVLNAMKKWEQIPAGNALESLLCSNAHPGRDILVICTCQCSKIFKLNHTLVMLVNLVGRCWKLVLPFLEGIWMKMVDFLDLPDTMVMVR